MTASLTSTQDQPLIEQRTQTWALVIATYKRADVLERCLQLAAEQTRPPAEIVVVNSGGGGMAELLAQNGIDVKVIENKRRLFVGAARNLGIMATRAPYVAFLASDCLATPGWTRHRLASHRKGKVAVASALLNGNPRNIVAWASYLATHHRRLPGTPKKKTSQYGASYAR